MTKTHRYCFFLTNRPTVTLEEIRQINFVVNEVKGETLMEVPSVSETLAPVGYPTWRRFPETGIFVRVGPVTFVDLGSRTRLAVAADHGAAQEGCRCFVFPNSSSV